MLLLLVSLGLTPIRGLLMLQEYQELHQLVRELLVRPQHFPEFPRLELNLRLLILQETPRSLFVLQQDAQLHQQLLQ